MVVEIKINDIRTPNGTVIPEKKLIEALKVYSEGIKDDCVSGFVHGADNVDENGCYKIGRVSHLVSSIEVSSDNAKAEISFPNTVWGNITERISDVEGSFFAPRLAFDGEELKEVVSIDFCLNKVGYDERKKK